MCVTKFANQDDTIVSNRPKSGASAGLDVDMNLGIFWCTPPVCLVDSAWSKFPACSVGATSSFIAGKGAPSWPQRRANRALLRWRSSIERVFQPPIVNQIARRATILKSGGLRPMEVRFPSRCPAFLYCFEKLNPGSVDSPRLRRIPITLKSWLIAENGRSTIPIPIHSPHSSGFARFRTKLVIKVIGLGLELAILCGVTRHFCPTCEQPYDCHRVEKNCGSPYIYDCHCCYLQRYRIVISALLASVTQRFSDGQSQGGGIDLCYARGWLHETP